MTSRFLARFPLLAAASLPAFPALVFADDTPSSCDALRQIVAAAPDGFKSLRGTNGAAGVALPYGDDARCMVTDGGYQWTWTPRGGSGADALQAAGAEIAACLPDATHDLNTPALQRFYMGELGHRTQITATLFGATRLRLAVTAR
jgi:hypothetical protein